MDQTLQDDSYEPYKPYEDLEPFTSPKFPPLSSSEAMLSDNELSWDEEINGDRIVFDASYELNADLTPWNTATQEELEEIFGLYV